MVFDEIENNAILVQLRNKKIELDDTIKNIENCIDILEGIKNSKSTELDVVIPIDKGTWKEITDERRNEIFDNTKEKTLELL